MHDLNYDLKRLEKAHGDGSHGTRKGRSVGTIKNRTAHLRWWAERIGRPGVVPSNGALGIANREYVTNEDKSVVLDPDRLALVRDEHVVMALRMEAEFGLRREEAIKFMPSRDDRGDRIRLKGSTTKGPPARGAGSEGQPAPAARRGASPGGRRRADPAEPQLQAAVEGVREPDAGGGPVPDARAAASLRADALRGDHRVEVAGGGRAVAADADGARRRIDTTARRTVARELGHDRPSVVSVYIGS